MKIVIGDIKTGKTVKAIKFAAKENSILIVPHESDAKEAREYALKHHLHLYGVYTFAQFLSDRTVRGIGYKDCKVVIDNADLLLSYLTPFNISMITMSEEVVNERH